MRQLCTCVAVLIVEFGFVYMVSLLVLCDSFVCCTFVLNRVFCFSQGVLCQYCGKLLREKTFVNFAFLWLHTNIFSVKFWGVALFGAAKVSNLQKFPLQKLYFSLFLKSFLPQTFPAIRY